MRLRETLANALWVVTHVNVLGWPDERRHRLSSRYQHRLFTVGGGWLPGRLPARLG